MLTLDNLKVTTNSSSCSCGTSYCSDTGNVFDNNQGITSSTNSSLSK